MCGILRTHCVSTSGVGMATHMPWSVLQVEWYTLTSTGARGTPAQSLTLVSDACWEF